MVFSENFLAPNSFSKFIFVVCNVWYNAREVYLLDKKPWFCCFSSNFFVKVKFNRAWGSVIGNISELMQHDERGETTANLVWQVWQWFCLKKPSIKLRIPKNISVKKIPDKLVTWVITPVTFVTHRHFTVLFFLPSCCVNSLLTKWTWQPWHKLWWKGFVVASEV